MLFNLFYFVQQTEQNRAFVTFWLKLLIIHKKLQKQDFRLVPAWIARIHHLPALKFVLCPSIMAENKNCN